MNNPCIRPIEDLPSLCPNPFAIVDILKIHEKVLIQQSDLVNDLFADNNAGETNPLRMKRFTVWLENNIETMQQ
jgi:hypothetical protein